MGKETWEETLEQLQKCAAYRKTPFNHRYLDISKIKGNLLRTSIASSLKDEICYQLDGLRYGHHKPDVYDKLVYNVMGMR
jgi:hypothetical protein